MEKNPNAESLTEDIACVCLQRSSSLRRKWRKRYGGLDGNKLLEPEEDLLQATEEAHKVDESKLRNADDQVTAPRPASRILTQNHPPSPVQRPISLVSPGAAGAPGAWCPVVPVSANGSCLKPLPPQASVPPKDRCPQVAQSWCPPQQTPTKRRVAADVLFDTFACDGRINTNHFFEAVWSSGLHRSDSRLRDCMSLLRKLQDADACVDRSTFHRCVTGVVSLLMKALQGRLVIPDFSSFTEDTQKLFSRCRQLSCSQNKDNVDATKWAVSVCTVDGQRLSLGDWATPLPLGELSWPLVYGVAVELLGSQLVHRYVGVEPYCTRESPFSLSKAGTPCSPLTETGAIVTTSLLQLPGRLCADEEEKYDSVLNVIQRLCNKEHANINCSRCVNANIFQSGKNANVRLQALAFYLEEKKCSPEKTDVNAALDLLLQASIPAVASIHGGLLAVIPGVLGLMAFSPELDVYGNPWRAVHFCQELVSTFQLHSFDIRTPFRQVLAYRQWKAESEGYHIINVLLAAFKGDVGALRRYFLSGVDVNAVDYDGRSALHLAAAEGHTEVIRFLLENAGANATLKDRWGTSPLQEARRHNRDGAAQLLQGTT
ncbi:glutaminase liver isoform, mitochondrial isoform X3 [Nerophis ophidion]|uniref:glutaminase liver isoform, mitochondrial isoform X3 n=1 Tax=Nerophis ophidion TaxID=159077 RepID=UPI002AE07F88|nr:glutaminase liver isoform, mitochondrial isoform X3 [Nerophis ophidion]